MAEIGQGPEKPVNSTATRSGRSAITRRRVLTGAGAAILLRPGRGTARTIRDPELGRLRVDRVAEGLEHPVALGFLPRRQFLVAEAQGAIALLRRGERPRRLSGVPHVFAHRLGGMFDLLVPPDIARARRLLISHARPSAVIQARLEVAEARFDRFSEQLTDLRPVFTETASRDSPARMGGRMVADGADGFFLLCGDRGEEDRRFDPESEAGKIFRFRRDGSLPLDGPRLAGEGLRGLWSMGHVNPRAGALRPADGRLWIADYARGTGAWLHRVLGGLGYLWPGAPPDAVPEGGPPAVAPLHVFADPLRPVAMCFVTGGRFRRWEGQLLIASDRPAGITRLVLDGERVVGERPFLDDRLGTPADLRMGPDGALWLLAGGKRGELFRIEPA
ncbi:MAG: hypothetical protein D6754_12245 [Alphaproteobacteria bacterium]|nr:MAG: hypothetical protein D6754_12245 [Alphaproteobacteria bacterium]